MILWVHSILHECRVLGPGRRAVIWVQGCPRRCRGCMSPDTLPFDGGTPYTTGSLVDRFDSLDVDGLTLSGGEIFSQAAAAVEIVDGLRERRDWSVMAYTGYTLEQLLKRGDRHQRKLLSLLDLLVDGPYREDLHAALRWRGSTNQRVFDLSGRHKLSGPDFHAGLEVGVVNGIPTIVGVPPHPHFLSSFEHELEVQGVHVALAAKSAKE